MYMRFVTVLQIMLLVGLSTTSESAVHGGRFGDPVATFSIVAYDSTANEWGVAVQSKFLAVGAVVPWAKAGTGAIATQAWANTTYGPEGLQLLSMGIAADDVVRLLTAKDAQADRRQLGVVDARGQVAAWTGDRCAPWAGHVVGPDFCAQGNILVGEDVVQGMAKAFQSTTGSLGKRLIAALAGGQQAGGDSRGRQSAALLVVRDRGGYSGFNDRFVDLRVDDHPTPIEELQRVFELHEQTFQGGAYVRIGISALAEGDTLGAHAALERALEITQRFPDNPDLLNSIAWELAINEFRLDDALDLAKKAVGLAPDDGNIWDTLGEVHARRGEYEEAVKAQSRAVELSPGSKEFEEKLKEWQARIRS